MHKNYRVVHRNCHNLVFLQFSINTEATLMCNKSYERKFCWILGDIFKNCEKLSYGAEFAFFWKVAELANKPITRYW